MIAEAASDTRVCIGTDSRLLFFPAAYTAFEAAASAIRRARVRVSSRAAAWGSRPNGLAQTARRKAI
ncbi:hypothetical protein [Marivita sp. XM-24bin2]|uniref:hypothetical protein n=1 Tax=unclassified Marivita TaxID=2632480 RepID=UPI000D7A1795|nr:hypothetical protein [Marivita sp. XM-24bin2]MCR9108627.1 hypothetical protein [Paracoccaceae bacterium]PWL33452.1 MAG: hypothetical protein DCO97_19490 [Marivita sp. XM-24bin2]